MNDPQIPASMDALNKLLDGGWGALDDRVNESANYEAQQANYEKALLIATPFRSGAGQAALQALKEITILAPTWDSENREFYSAAAYGFAREGQNSIIRHIERCIALVDQGPPKAPQQQQTTTN